MTAELRNIKQIKIRKMSLRDYDSAYLLWKRTSGMHLREAEDNFTEISRLIKFNPDLCFVAEFKHRIIGTVMGATDGRRGKVYHLAIDGDFRNLKLASNLLDRVYVRLKEVGIRKISICVMKNNQIGENFWEHCGFQKRTDINYFDRFL
ncbi:acetyltransferase [Liquorilactobacillus aquaticus DSM 21051]|uniref:Acetyltransferase n=1 Tax=Liquorilactobacillus aquaticus DSM 21051 TaxID=1423725 RepID=A0A0R2CZ06_9LACO|nr:GNAT family N-acetyltransferase [Liquorilactobacillus aquaticus]KRM97085.1 acetyltransferase [Liquorilactobacillus aquaticus DSM 21051]